MAATLAIIAAACFALAATLQQKGALGQGGVSLAHPPPCFGCCVVVLVVSPAPPRSSSATSSRRWRSITAGSSVIQPLLVTTIVFALPLGYFITAQHVGRRRSRGAIVVVLGLAVFTAVGDPAGGRPRPRAQRRVGDHDRPRARPFVGVLIALGGKGTLERKAGMYGAAAGLLYGLSASLWKPSAEMIDAGGVSAAFSSWEIYACGLAGIARVRRPAGFAWHGPPGAVRRDHLRAEPRPLGAHRDRAARGDAAASRCGTRSSPGAGSTLAMWGAISISLAREGASSTEAAGEAAPASPAVQS